MSDVGNTYLNAKTPEKVYAIASVEFGDESVGKICVIARALNSLLSLPLLFPELFPLTQAIASIYTRDSLSLTPQQYSADLRVILVLMSIRSCATSVMIDTVTRDDK